MAAINYSGPAGQVIRGHAFVPAKPA